MQNHLLCPNDPRGLGIVDDDDYDDVAIYTFDINQPSLATPFYSVLVPVSAFMAISTVFHSVNSFDKSPLAHSVLPV